MSQALVQLAADMASFNNASPEDVLLAIRSGLIGEAEPLRRYGVLLSETRVQQQALVETGKDNVKNLTDQEKLTARYNIILKDTGTAQGDAARTAGSWANQSRKLRANLDDLSAGLGQKLIPVLEDAAAHHERTAQTVRRPQRLPVRHRSLAAARPESACLDLTPQRADLEGIREAG